MHDRELAEPQLQWAIEQQQLVVEAADAKLRWAERMLAQAGTERAAVEAHNRADVALIDVEMAEERLRQLQRQMVTVAARRLGRPGVLAGPCPGRRRCSTSGETQHPSQFHRLDE